MDLHTTTQHTALPTAGSVRRRAPRLAVAALALTGALGLSACGAGGDAAASSGSGSGSASDTASSSSAPASESGAAGASSSGAAEQSSAEGPLTMTDAWTKATDTPMTGSFGTLENTSDEDVHVTAVRSEITDRVELHEMVADDKGQMTMQQAPDGFTVPAGESVELAPGGNHVMLMGLTDPIEAGDEVTYVLEFEDGGTLEVTSTARPFTGANESYHGGEASGSAGMGGAGMSGHGAGASGMGAGMSDASGSATMGGDGDH